MVNLNEDVIWTGLYTVIWTGWLTKTNRENINVKYSIPIYLDLTFNFTDNIVTVTKYPYLK